MYNSKSWNWEVVEDNIWNTPSEDSYYYLHRWKNKQYKDFLDLGCGLGRHSILFAENGFNTYSFDLSDYAIEKVREFSEKHKLSINTMVGDILNLPYQDNYFDCLLSYHVISHTDSKGIKIILSEIKRVLKPNGEFLITLCSKNSVNFQNAIYPKIDENTIVKTEEPEKDIPHFYVNYNEIKDLVSMFEIIRIRHIQDFYNENNTWHYFIHGKKK